MALDRKTGKVVWQQTAKEEVPHQGRRNTGSWASPSAVTDGEHLIAYFGSRDLYCYGMDGNLQWEKDFGVKDRFYLASQDGTILVVKHGPTYEVLATNTLDDSFNASPVIVGNELYLRGQRHLYCIASD
jgi:outer membrane protein assembly factor BamB